MELRKRKSYYRILKSRSGKVIELQIHPFELKIQGIYISNGFFNAGNM